ncbi:MAG: 30S ribosomal protein S17 [Chloroflexi bacterium]|nr:30S ribosomal protein S17 [Chloroflexota bacterium]
METKRKERVGRVVSDKMNKTIVVAVGVTRRHPLYRRTIREQRRYKAHDERNECRTGDLVRIVETRPLSKEKRWRVAEIIGRGPGEVVSAGVEGTSSSASG